MLEAAVRISAVICCQHIFDNFFFKCTAAYHRIKTLRHSAFCLIVAAVNCWHLFGGDSFPFWPLNCPLRLGMGFLFQLTISFANCCTK